tara:strand:- start:4362 stop:4664 length:303 start_codon:yes stop_codon:yes gene_type:complete
MSIILTLVLIQLYAMCVSAMVIPVTRPVTNKIWDLQRGLDFNTLYDAALKDSKPELIEVKNTPSPSTKLVKREKAVRRAKTMHSPAIADMPVGGMQCAVM